MGVLELERTDPYAVQKYDEQAKELERLLRDRMPLLQWHVLSFDDHYGGRPVTSYLMRMITFRVEAKGEIGNRVFVASKDIVRERVMRSLTNQDVIEYVASDIAHALAHTLLDWRKEGE